MKKLLTAFNRRAKKTALTAVAAFALIGGISHDSPPAHALPEVAAATQTADTVKVPYATSQARLDTIKAKIALTPTGQALIDYAVRENIRIEMSDSKAMDDDPKDNIFIKGLNYGHLIRLNGDIASDDAIMLTLAHEIRHSWHDRTVKSDELQLEPRREWLKRRIQEADCFAYEIHFAYEYEKATGKKLSIGNRATNDYAKLLGAYEKARAAEGATVSSAYTALLEKTFVHVNGLDYDKRFTTQLQETWTEVAAKQGLMPSYSARMVDPATDADFVREMREVATAGLDIGFDPAALSTWTEADFLSFEKTGGTPSKKDQQTFDSAQAKFLEARTTWQLLHPANDDVISPPAMSAPGRLPPTVMPVEKPPRIARPGA
ncbi:MAG: hypothetical protein K0R10_2312 [Alphaproteobacteria bacterium]|nr:hypothetical protein [Alphaproteobacteria bacterium]